MNKPAHELGSSPRDPRSSRFSLRGFLSGLMAVTGCKPRGGELAGAEITYRADGRPQHVSLFALQSPPACTEAVRALFLSSVAPRGHATPAGRKEVVLAALDSEVIASFDVAAPGSGGASDLRGASGLHAVGSVKEPKKVRNVAPQYPDGARNSRTQGTVLLEAVIAPSGCVKTVKTLRSVHPSLDIAAIRAVSGWRYEPTLLDGIPVQVIMTVTVNFRLR